MSGVGGWLLILVLILTIWNPASLALQASSIVWTLGARSTVSLTFLAARLAITSIGVAAGIALFLRRPGAVWLAKLALVLLAIEAVTRLDARRPFERSAGNPSAPRRADRRPQRRLVPVSPFLASRSRVYGLESQSQR
jgi:hypothetical protein